MPAWLPDHNKTNLIFRPHSPGNIPSSASPTAHHRWNVRWANCRRPRSNSPNAVHDRNAEITNHPTDSPTEKEPRPGWHALLQSATVLSANSKAATRLSPQPTHDVSQARAHRQARTSANGQHHVKPNRKFLRRPAPFGISEARASVVAPLSVPYSHAGWISSSMTRRKSASPNAFEGPGQPVVPSFQHTSREPPCCSPRAAGQSPHSQHRQPDEQHPKRARHPRSKGSHARKRYVTFRQQQA